MFKEKHQSDCQYIVVFKNFSNALWRIICPPDWAGFCAPKTSEDGEGFAVACNNITLPSAGGQGGDAPGAHDQAWGSRGESRFKRRILERMLQIAIKSIVETLSILLGWYHISPFATCSDIWLAYLTKHRAGATCWKRREVSWVGACDWGGGQADWARQGPDQRWPIIHTHSGKGNQRKPDENQWHHAQNKGACVRAVHVPGSDHFVAYLIVINPQIIT